MAITVEIRACAAMERWRPLDLLSLEKRFEFYGSLCDCKGSFYEIVWGETFF